MTRREENLCTALGAALVIAGIGTAAFVVLCPSRLI